MFLPAAKTHTQITWQICEPAWLYFGNSQISSVKQIGMITESITQKRGLIMMYDSVVSSDLASAFGRLSV